MQIHQHLDGSCQFDRITAKTSDLVIGESVIGETSGAHAIVAVKETDSKISSFPKIKLVLKKERLLYLKNLE